MKCAVVILAVAATIAPLGCVGARWDQERVQNVQMVNSAFDEQAEAAILAQQTIFPYHFVGATATLTDLGRHDLDVLARHYREHHGELVLRKGGANDELYASRIESVRAYLAREGVDPDWVAIRQGEAGGAGMSSERALQTLQEEYELDDAEPESSTAGLGDATAALEGVAR